MAAAGLRERRADHGPRAKTPGDRPRPRASRPAAPPTSKLKAARGVGLTSRMAAVAAGALAVLILVAALATGGRAGRVADGAARVASRALDVAGAARGLVGDNFAGIGFRVAEVHLQGSSPSSRDEILRAAAVRPGVPVLGLDLDAIRARVERVGWVEHARIIRLLPDTLVIAVRQRPLLAVWQHHGRLDVVAVDGRVAGGVNPRDFTTLPRIIGDGANADAASLLTELYRRPKLYARIQAIRRVDGRRWDLLLRDGDLLMLSASDPVAALARLDRLRRTSHILDLGLARIDLRSTEFTVARPKGAVPTTSVSRGV